MGDIEEVTRKVAGRYISEALFARSGHREATNKDITALPGCRNWLLRRGNVEYNAWANQALAKVKPKTGEQRSKRPFTGAKVTKLFGNIEPGMLRDAMLVAALSGLRTGEIAQRASAFATVASSVSRKPRRRPACAMYPFMMIWPHWSRRGAPGKREPITYSRNSRIPVRGRLSSADKRLPSNS